MLIPKENRKAIHQTLFQQGVLVAKKDFNLPKHPEVGVPNLQVIKACQSLDSRGYLKTRYNWGYFYYTLNNEGVEYLREYLHLPAEVVPATHKRQVRPAAPRATRPEPRERAAGDAGYRRAEKKDDGAAPGGFTPSFRGGFGRPVAA
ncbi:40S ribosomal protein S10 [Schizosaccharomyces cryophilus OY26]|uniref:40S ribosomal protein S10 n=1 Tax=Schizosaccharomyces cryophilus (strain OY26 / ATCC MYA-4695 / CBS 11777 / NBRC 106824 / NRRL Y48691) TaxID=653667 RepID=S9VST5_SCHCR|nr:40S ribosomal protein S10 [Schizosaccharomyces cryophilus OY26]EPY49234.1 40S ribosomal protein S10 [Schizosaccharomyces cryophilus OY26]